MLVEVVEFLLLELFAYCISRRLWNCLHEQRAAGERGGALMAAAIAEVWREQDLPSIDIKKHTPNTDKIRSSTFLGL